MAIVTLRKIKKTDLLGRPSYKDAKTYFTVTLNKKTGFPNKILNTQEEIDYYSNALNISKSDLENSNSDFWRDFTFIMQGESAELDDEDPQHKLVIKLLEKDNTVALTEKEKLEKSEVAFVLIKESEITENKNKNRSMKAEAYSKYALMSEEDLQKVLLAYGKNPRTMNAAKIKELVGDELEANPQRFLSFISDKNYEVKVFINDLVQESIIKRTGSSYKFDGEIIATDTDTMVAYLKNNKNTNSVVAFKRMLNEKKGSKKYDIAE